MSCESFFFCSCFDSPLTVQKGACSKQASTFALNSVFSYILGMRGRVGGGGAGFNYADERVAVSCEMKAKLSPYLNPIHISPCACKRGLTN